MSDFRKGLIVGMLIIFGCGAFVASTTNNSNSQRYELHGGLMLDSWKGNLYVMPNNKEDEKKPMDQRKKQNWKLMLEVDQKDANDKKVWKVFLGITFVIFYMGIFISNVVHY